MYKKIKELTKVEKITMVRKVIEDQKIIHDYIVNGKDLSELKKLGIKFAQPL